MANKIKKYGLMIYPGTPTYNVGDYVQSLAAKQYLPKVDVLIEREKLKKYSGHEVNMIMNGWYIHNPEQFKPSSKINPLYISFHLNSHFKDIILSDQNNVEYLKTKSPIGCRDYSTLESLRYKGIDAYYSGCLTTTLDLKYSSKEKSDNIYFCDPVWILPHWAKLMYGKKNFIKGIVKGDVFKFNKRKQVLASLFSEEILNKAINIKHKLPGKHSEERRFKEAELFLKKLASAKLVVTSRIHAALPCLALGTPVIFINYGFDRSSDQSRFKGIIELFNTINIDDSGKISANFELPNNEKISLNDIIENPMRYLDFAESLKDKCSEFIVI
jgi:hypothetical protein